MAGESASGQTYPEIVAALRARLAAKPGTHALLLLDLADLSRLQARLGFESSAALMQTMHRNFAQVLAERGLALRFGDARFCLLVSDVKNRGHAVLAAEKLLRAAEDTMTQGAIAIRPEIQVGIALFPAQANEPGELVRKAQLAAAMARKRRQRLLVFDEACAVELLEPWELGEAFVAALESGALEVCYQPKIRIADSTPAGAEVLMRWMHDGKPVASPDVFIPLAEESGLIHDTTWYAMTNALRLAAECDNLPVAVNVTPGMLHHREFVEMVRSAMTSFKVPEGALTLEMTEGALISDFQVATEKLGTLRAMGARISIDDFGTGYSSLSYFKKIPADELKIDKSFVMGMMKDDADQRLVATIVELARQFRLEVVAEGVEDRATFERLGSMGCDYAQGYLFAPALRHEAFKTWLAANRPRRS